MGLFKLMATCRGLRGSVIDPFRFTPEAAMAEAQLAAYEADIAFALENLGTQHADSLLELLSLPEHIRGYGRVREQHAREVEAKAIKLRAKVKGLAQAVAA